MHVPSLPRRMDVRVAPLCGGGDTRTRWRLAPDGLSASSGGISRPPAANYHLHSFHAGERCHVEAGAACRARLSIRSRGSSVRNLSRLPTVSRQTGASGHTVPPRATECRLSRPRTQPHPKRTHVLLPRASPSPTCNSRVSTSQHADLPGEKRAPRRPGRLPRARAHQPGLQAVRNL